MRCEFLTTLAVSLIDASEAEIEIDLRVRFNYHPAQPAYTPRGEYAPTDPPEPALVEIDEISVAVPQDGRTVWQPAPRWLHERLEDALVQGDTLYEHAEVEPV